MDTSQKRGRSTIELKVDEWAKWMSEKYGDGRSTIELKVQRQIFKLFYYSFVTSRSTIELKGNFH